ncbi:MAG: hypothetical protein GY750_00395 [Lentisphaerae bacterium]|nr:hypothetical protein [Lentisphaerota bacterium]MCP4099879.1 hypothetical protein [Lentisphaerota bacterium]
MVKLIKYLVIIAVISVAGIFAWKYFFGKSEINVLKNRIYSLASEASKKPGESLPSAIMHAKTVEKFFTDPCQVDVGTHMFSGQYSQVQIGANSIRYRYMFQKVTFTVHDLEVTLTGNDTAKAFLTAELNGLTKSGQSVSAFRELECTLVNRDGKWLVSKVAINKIIEK